MDVSIDDPESADAGSGPAPLDLTPRDAPRPSSRRGIRRFAPWLLAVAVLGAIGVVASGLAGATTYFYNVDDAVAKRSEIGDRRVRLQGNILKGSVDQTGDGLKFVLKYNGVSVNVSHTGDVPDLFGPSIPVVIEGRFKGSRFYSDQVLVKHDETYDEKNKTRVKEADADARKNAASTTIPAP
ncbi:MAG: cytochrome c maturation protein CcmE [Acidimicrobiales bacterium]